MASMKDLKGEYDRLRKERLGKGKFMLKPTAKGYWGTAALADIEELFSQLDIKKANNFIDLGSGDGRVVLAASMFTNATGIECDQELMQISTEIRKKMDLPATFVCDDFFDLDLSKFDMIFVNPDNKFDKLETKLLMEMHPEAKLVVYNNLYLPSELKQHQKLNINGMDIRVFKK